MRALPIGAQAPLQCRQRCPVPTAAAAASQRRPCLRAASGSGQQRSSSRSIGGSRRLQTAWRLAATAAETEGSTPLLAAAGDIVTLNWKCFDEDGELLERSESAEEPTTFEVGAGDIVGNRLFEAFDEAVRGMAVGDVTRIKAEGGEWKKELLFMVPREHAEVQRLEGRYKNHGGLKEGLIVELSNGAMALVVKAEEEGVVLDANNMLAGKSMWFELELAELDRPASKAAAA